MHTVIASFDNRAAAGSAMQRLAAEGYAHSDMHVEDNPTQGAGDALQRERQRGQEHEHQGIFGRFFTSVFGDHDYWGDTHLYSEAVRRGNAVLVVDAPDEATARRASALMRELGAYDIDERAAQWRAGGWAGAPGQPRKLDVVQEEIQVGKREVDRGGVRIVQRVSDKPVREIVRLRDEVAKVERRPVDRAASPEDLQAFREGTTELSETTEVPVVTKHARVVEEVRVGKEVREREQIIEDSVRRKDVVVERFQPGNPQSGVPREERAAAAEPRDPAPGDKPRR